MATSSPLILDGAMGTELTRRGLDLHLPLWSAEAVLNHPDVVLQIHRDYLSAGADILTAATFRTESYTFLKAGCSTSSAHAACKNAVALCRHAITDLNPQRPILVAGSIAPLEDCYHPELTPPPEIIAEYQKERIGWLVEAGVDLLLLETMNNRREVLITAEIACSTGLPVITSLLLRDADHLRDGTPVKTILAELLQFAIVSIGINCVHHSIISRFLSLYAMQFPYPYTIYPNKDYYIDGQWSADNDFTPAIFPRIAAEWFSFGAKIIGGCCGTTPDYIAALGRHFHPSQLMQPGS